MSPSRIPRILTGSLLLAALALAPAAAWAFTATLTIPNLCAAPIDVTLFSLEANNTVVVSGGFDFETATIARVHLLGCTGAPLPSAADYKCIVTDASVNLTSVGGVTCSVSIP